MKNYILYIQSNGIGFSLVKIFEVLTLQCRSSIVSLFLRFRGIQLGENAVFHGRNFFPKSKCSTISLGNNVIFAYQTKVGTFPHAKLTIGNNVNINECVHIYAGESIEIGDGTLIAPFCYIMDWDHKIDGKKPIMNSGMVTKRVVIGKNVWIGTGVKILKGVTVGDGAVIGAGAVVTKDIPSFSIAAGVPAKVIKKR